MKAVCTGIVTSQRAITDATGGDATFIHVEAAFSYDEVGGVRSEEAALLRDRRFLSGDLVTGRVDESHPLIA